MRMPENFSLSPSILFALNQEGVKETRTILPPSLEGLTPEKSEQATDEFFCIRLRENSEVLISKYPGAEVFEVNADSEEIARDHYSSEMGSLINRLRRVATSTS